MLVFTLASAACAAAPTLGVLVAARAAQAGGAFHHVWLAEVIAALAACLAVVVTAGQPAGRAPR